MLQSTKEYTIMIKKIAFCTSELVTGSASSHLNRFMNGKFVTDNFGKMSSDYLTSSFIDKNDYKIAQSSE